MKKNYGILKWDIDFQKIAMKDMDRGSEIFHKISKKYNGHDLWCLILWVEFNLKYEEVKDFIRENKQNGN